VRRVAWLALVAWWCGCPLPEDRFVVSGSAPPSTEVRLLRNRFGSKTRCAQLEPLSVTRTDAQGRFSFEVLRQQITGGEAERRFFSVEFGEGVARSRRFWFPDADLELGDWVEPPDDGLREFELDGAVAWRTGAPSAFPGFALDRDGRQRTFSHAFEWKEVPIDSLGRVDYVPVESRTERPWEPFQALARAPISRGADCPFIDVKPCPLTDGRFLPFTLPPDSRTLVFNFGRDYAIRNVAFHGLLLARPAVKVKYDFNFVLDYEQWNPTGAVKLDPVFIDRASEHCSDPGLFVTTTPFALRALILRVSFEDEAGALVPVVSLAELSAQ
jgi:hypothetical protein